MISMTFQHMAALVLLASAVTWLLVTVRMLRSQRGIIIAAAVIAVLGSVPIAGISAAGFVLSFSSSLSVAGTVLWGLLLVRRMGVAGLDRMTASLSLMVFAVSTAVGLSVILGVGLEAYNGAYGFTGWDIILAASCMAAFFAGRPLAYVLMACLAAHAFGLIDTSNIFDTLIDGPSFFLSIAITVRLLFVRVRG